MNLKIEDIKEMKKSKMKKLLDKAVEDEAFWRITTAKGKTFKNNEFQVFNTENAKKITANIIKVEEAQMVFMGK